MSHSDPSLRSPSSGFDRALGPVEATSLVIGTVVGAGIFVVPPLVAQAAGPYGAGAVLLVWALCGLLSLAGALAYAELAASFPRAGGQYVFLREAFGPLPAFLFGWMEFWLARAGSMGVAAVIFAHYAGHFTHLEGEWGLRWTAFLLVFALTLVNYLGVRSGGAVQVLCAALKVAALGALVACAFGLPEGSAANLQPLWTGAGVEAGGLVGALGTAMIAALWAFNGWANGAAVSEEMREPRRDVPRALVRGMLLVTGLYLAVNLAYLWVLPVTGVASSGDAATAVAEALFGPVGAGLAAVTVMAAAFGSVNGLLLSGPRLFYAMARDGLFFREIGELHPRFRTPHLAVLFQGLWAGFLILIPYGELFGLLFGWRPETPLYAQLFTLVLFASWAFYGLTVAGMLLLRRRRPELARPYRAWGYPAVPLLFVLGSVAFTAHVLLTRPAESLAGVCVVLLGLPAFWWWSRRQEPETAAEPLERAATGA
jgi:basic amino acid/polyamine antiporter, APA family